MGGEPGDQYAIDRSGKAPDRKSNKDGQSQLHITNDPAAMIPPKAMMAPTDRSIPPLRMTKSMPRLISPFVTIWRDKLIKFEWVRNCPTRVRLQRGARRRAP